MRLTRPTPLDGVPVLAVVGEIDASSAAGLQAELEGEVATAGPLLVLDLDGVGFFDSAGLKVLDGSRRHAADAGTVLALVCTQRQVLRLLQITGLDTRFPIYPTLEDAVRSGPRPMRDATLPLTRTPEAPRQARAFVAARLAGVSAGVCADALLLVSELVTNAVRYGASPAHLRLRVSAELIRVDVQDSADTLPTQQEARPDASSGRGLIIVAAIATAWGVEKVDVGGKQVWFELGVTAR